MNKRLQLYFWDGGNFGDDLNIWLWSQLIPNIVDTDAPYKKEGNRPLFVGIGTILTNHLPTNHIKAIFGSGAGYFELPIRDNSWIIYCVRGPLTAKILGLNSNLAITDPAALISTLDLPHVPKKYKYSFMPHHSSIESVDWKNVCGNLNIHYIDPTSDFEESLHEIMASEIVIAEAMHAAIVADALRIPWIPVNLHGKNINSFKWNDWCHSLKLTYEPITLGFGHNSRLIKRKLPSLIQEIVKKTINAPLASKVLKSAIHKGHPILSSSSIIEPATDRLLEQMYKLSQDVKNNIFKN